MAAPVSEIKQIPCAALWCGSPLFVWLFATTNIPTTSLGAEMVATEKKEKTKGEENHTSDNKSLSAKVASSLSLIFAFIFKQIDLLDIIYRVQYCVVTPQRIL